MTGQRKIVAKLGFCQKILVIDQFVHPVGGEGIKRVEGRIVILAS